MTGGLLPSLPAARALIDWLDSDAAQPLQWRLRARLSWGAFWFEQLLRTQKSQPVAAPPAFVMGFWRSGTTLLHNLLYERYTCAVPLTWQCHAPATFMLQRPPARDLSARRPMDDGRVQLLGPQEDEFALLLLGEPSLYRGFLDPTRLDQIADECLIDKSPILPRWNAFIAALSASDAPLLLKSPNHVFRLSTIAHNWPEAKMVWICRPFAEVLASNLHMWRSMIKLHHLRDGAFDLPSFLERAALSYRDVVKELLDDPFGQMLWLNNTDLTTAPNATAAAAAQFLGLLPRPASIVGVDSGVHPARTSPNVNLAEPRLNALAAEIDRFHALAIMRWGRHAKATH